MVYLMDTYVNGEKTALEKNDSKDLQFSISFLI